MESFSKVEEWEIFKKGLLNAFSKSTLEIKCIIGACPPQAGSGLASSPSLRAAQALMRGPDAPAPRAALLDLIGGLGHTAGNDSARGGMRSAVSAPPRDGLLSRQVPSAH